MSELPATDASAPAEPILKEGRTCRSITRADKVAVLIDGDCYFRALVESFRMARSRILIVGWDFDVRIRLDPTDPDTELRVMLPTLVRARPALHVHVLVWDIAPLFGPSAILEPLLEREWREHERIHFRFDGQHPAGASHHEKIVCVDDAIAFVGGIDLTTCRWDTRCHEPADPRRVATDGSAYEPVHDLQMAVSGDAARAVADTVRERWLAAGGDAIAPAPRSADSDAMWPASMDTWLAGVRVGIARTRPRTGDAPEITEVAALNDAALSAARRAVYVEAQYLTAEPVIDRLAELLRRPDPPEIVLLLWHEATGWIERFAMGSNRERALRRLARADHRRRLRVYKLTVPGARDREVLVHSKLIIVDDRFVRIGSSNFNNRSLGFDTECDLAFEATDASMRLGIMRLRETLLAEHLGCSAEDVRRAVAATGLIAAIDQLSGHAGRLERRSIDVDAGPDYPIPATDLLDPAEPLDLEHLRRTILVRWRPE